MKAPNAMDKPARCINTAMITTIRSATAVNSSRISVRAIKRKAGLAMYCPASRIPATTAIPSPTEI